MRSIQIKNYKHYQKDLLFSHYKSADSQAVREKAERVSEVFKNNMGKVEIDKSTFRPTNIYELEGTIH